MTHNLLSSEHFIPTDQGQIFAKIWRPEGGIQAAPIILLHDSLGCIALWRDFPAALAARTNRTVVAYDRLGFGKSEASPILLDVTFVKQENQKGVMPIRQYFEIERFIAMGHSIGGGMAVSAAAEAPDACTAVITMSAQVFVEDRTLEGIRAAQKDFSDLSNFDRLARYHAGKTQWVLSAWIDTWLSPAFADWNIDPALRKLKCPLLAIHGENDEYGTLAHPQRLVELSGSGGQMCVLAGCRHFPHREKEGDVLAAIGAFLAAKSL